MRNSMYFLWVIAFIGIMQACTETEYLDFEKEPGNRILQYRVTNSQQELLGAIDNEKNTITVYIPYYLGIDYLNAEVKLEEGAKLLDGDGNEINLDGGLAPIRVSPDSATYNYTVVAPTGQQRTYTLFQKVLPYPHPLKVSYAELDSLFVIPVNFYLEITGNFESTITNSKIILTDKASGAVHEDWIRPASMTAGDNEYVLRTLISPEAKAGEYRVRVEHQGRSASLPDLKLVYSRPLGSGEFARSTANYAPGDTITFNADAVYRVKGGYDGGIFLPIDRFYLKIVKDYPGRYGWMDFAVPDGFPDSLFGKEIEMKVVSQTRTEVKCIFPDIPAGSYQGNSSSFEFYPREDGRQGLSYKSNFGFYVDWAESTGWGKGYGLASVGVILFTVNPKK